MTEPTPVDNVLREEYRSGYRDGLKDAHDALAQKESSGILPLIGIGIVIAYLAWIMVSRKESEINR